MPWTCSLALLVACGEYEIERIAQRTDLSPMP